MTTTYRADEPVRRNRLKALEAALFHVKREYTEKDQKVAAAKELLGFQAFTAAQVAGWLGLSERSLDGQGDILKWGVGQIGSEQLQIAIDLAKCGVAGTKPKTLIHRAYTDAGLSFNAIGGLLGIHKNVARRIIRRIDGEPWS